MVKLLITSKSSNVTEFICNVHVNLFLLTLVYNTLYTLFLSVHVIIVITITKEKHWIQTVHEAM